jgi:hypothetical protein
MTICKTILQVGHKIRIPEGKESLLLPEEACLLNKVFILNFMDSDLKVCGLVDNKTGYLKLARYALIRENIFERV